MPVLFIPLNFSSKYVLKSSDYSLTIKSFENYVTSLKFCKFWKGVSQFDCRVPWSTNVKCGENENWTTDSVSFSYARGFSRYPSTVHSRATRTFVRWQFPRPWYLISICSVARLPPDQRKKKNMAPPGFSLRINTEQTVTGRKTVRAQSDRKSMLAFRTLWSHRLCEVHAKGASCP